MHRRKDNWDVLITGVRDAATRRVVVANGVAGLVVTTYLVIVGPPPKGSWVTSLVVTFGAFAAAFGILVAVAVRVARRLVTRNVRWLEEQRDPTPEERSLVLRAPLTFAVYPLPFWLLSAIATSLLPSVGGTGSRIGTFVTVMLGAAVTSALSFALIERGMREVTTLALAGAAPDEPAQINLRLRLFLAWALGSGIPLLGIALTPALRSPDASLPLAVPVVLLAIVGLVSGLAIAIGQATSIAEPMEALRECFERIRRGEFRTSLDVDAAGEIGMLQAGFNEMAAGLQEREQLRDLFGRHVGEEVARAAVEQGVQLGGEQREVSILFVDVIASSELARANSPDRVVALLNRFFSAGVHAVDREAGWVNKFEGDGALCVFGAPNREPEHAACALRAAIALRDALADLGIDAAIGVSSGTVVAGNVGTEARYEYTVIGHPVNEASRITDEAKREDGRLLASAAAVAAAPNEAARWRSVGVRELRGVGPTEVYADAEHA
jgi:adenylate cyclase